MDTEEPIQQINLFQNIALTFSGGGYRASSFSLGILSYLNHVQFEDKALLDNVKGLSTVSGGTLTGATYAYFAEKGNTFTEFYDHFYNTLNDDKLLEIALEKLADDSIWKNSHKKRSLINAFSLAYAELLTDGTFNDIDKRKPKSHLEDICFNASDFSFGLAFRFQTTGKFGNYRLQNTNLSNLSKEMKIADAIASSSCFPLGFEPIIMPDDFISDQSNPDYIALKANENFKKGVGLMDGGILDNQGIGSIMKANNRRIKKDKAFDLFMVCDVGSYFMDPWEPTIIEKEEKTWSKSPKQLYYSVVKCLNLSWMLFVPILIGATLLTVGFIFPPGLWWIIPGSGLLTLGIITIGIHYLLRYLKKEILSVWNWLMGKLPKFIKAKLHYFENLKVRLFKRMLEERTTSGLKMVNEIFLKQIRRLNYDLFYKSKNLENRRITTLIYELTKDQFKEGKSDEKEKDKKIPYVPEPGDLIYNSAKIASDMSTTLWFTESDREQERLKNLVSCGQYTACYNLLKYCIDLRNSEVGVNSKLLNRMIKIFRDDWKEFIENPYWLHQQMQ